MNPTGQIENRDIGWRARIGVIYPEDGLLDSDFYRPAPEGVSVHITRSFHQMSEEKLDLQLAAVMAESDDIEASAKTFVQIEPDCVAYACTSASFSQGKGADQRIIDRIKSVTKSKATTTASAAVAALRSLDAERVTAIAPYGREVSNQLAAYLEEYGFKVTNLNFMDVPDLEIAKLDPGYIYRFVKESYEREADAVFISCTNLRSFEVVLPLENDLRKPVVSANQATIWHALRLSGVHEAHGQHGLLFTRSTTD